jgi:transposase
MNKADKIQVLKNNGTYNNHYAEVKKSDFVENKFYDPMDAVQVKYEMLRDGESGIRPIKDVAEDFGFSRATYYNIKEGFEKRGIASLFPEKTGPKAPHKLSQDICNFVDDYITFNPDKKVLDILEEIYEKKNVKISRRTLERYLEKKKRHNDISAKG